MQRLFPDHPELLQATMEIADRCNLQLELGNNYFPEFNVAGGANRHFVLWKAEFLKARVTTLHKPLRPAVLSRLTHELEGDRKNCTWRPIFCWCGTSWRRRGGAGFGGGARSAASSMVTYCLGISRYAAAGGGCTLKDF